MRDVAKQVSRIALDLADEAEALVVAKNLVAATEAERSISQSRQ